MIHTLSICLGFCKKDLNSYLKILYQLNVHYWILVSICATRKLGQVFIKNGLKEVNYEKYKSISILYPIDYQ